MSYSKPTGHETDAPTGLDRQERLSWWTEWKLARYAENTSTGLGATAFDYFIIHPTKRCSSCSNGGVIMDGQLRTCETCRGLGYLMMTLEEIRAEYRAIRDEVCEANVRLTEEDFHQATREWIAKQGPGRDGPGYYLAAARAIQTKYARERQARRIETRSKW